MADSVSCVFDDSYDFWIHSISSDAFGNRVLRRYCDEEVIDTTVQLKSIRII